jgi:hypothetical protein
MAILLLMQLSLGLLPLNSFEFMNNLSPFEQGIGINDNMIQHASDKYLLLESWEEE